MIDADKAQLWPSTTDRVSLFCTVCDAELCRVDTLADAATEWDRHIGEGHQEPSCICSPQSDVQHPDCPATTHVGRLPLVAVDGVPDPPF